MAERSKVYEKHAVILLTFSNFINEQDRSRRTVRRSERQVEEAEPLQITSLTYYGRRKSTLFTLRAKMDLPSRLGELCFLPTTYLPMGPLPDLLNLLSLFLLILTPSSHLKHCSMAKIGAQVIKYEPKRAIARHSPLR